MNGVAIVIYVNMAMSCLYQIVPYMYYLYPLLWTIKKILYFKFWLKSQVSI